jgi:hypothetical protein
MSDLKLDVYYADLAPHIQEWLLEAYGISSPEERNWDVFPVTQVYAAYASDDDEMNDDL